MRRPSSFSSSLYSDDSQDPQDSQYPQGSSDPREDSEAKMLSRLLESYMKAKAFEAYMKSICRKWLHDMIPSWRRESPEEMVNALMAELKPLVQVDTGYIHPEFPRCVIHFWLLDNEQLDSLMEFYHQKPGTSYWMNHYPEPVGWEDNLSLDRKRRRFGRFIGLRGCESPVVESFPKDQCLEPEPDNHRLGLDDHYADPGNPYGTSDAWSSPSDDWRLDLISQYSKQSSPSLHSAMSLLSNPAPGYWELIVSYWEETQKAKLKRRTS